ncbi:DoxX family protein [Pareuzebyella sediminis]|uniref:DoxX family protein n=1 Tax=Pareuzebyella sediminis TaxID=2607998 RepID=UPI0011ED93D4|nr:DoxX family protein [Pareuzebyella sediminis]
MEKILENAAEILLLLFLIIVFLQSSIDKVFDWAGNLSWLKEHFSGTPLSNIVPILLMIVLLTEMVSSVLCTIGLYQIAFFNENTLAFYGALLSCLSLLMLLFGQRVAKDYEGAKTIAVYFMPAAFLVYLLQ